MTLFTPAYLFAGELDLFGNRSPACITVQDQRNFQFTGNWSRLFSRALCGFVLFSSGPFDLQDASNRPGCQARFQGCAVSTKAQHHKKQSGCKSRLPETCSTAVSTAGDSPAAAASVFTCRWTQTALCPR